MNKKSLLILIFLCYCISGIQAQNRAPSINLSYIDNTEDGYLLMNSVKVVAPSPTYTYYSVLNWNIGSEGSGYCGIQEHPRGRNFIFSLWDPISSSRRTYSTYSHSDAEVSRFGGEGTGIRTLNFGLGWRTNTTYRFVVRTWQSDNETHFGCWVEDSITGRWTYLATLVHPVSDLVFSPGAGSFIEDWFGNGHLPRSVQYADGWKRELSSNWSPFTAGIIDIPMDASASNFLSNYDVKVVNDNTFQLTSGGTTTPSSNLVPFNENPLFLPPPPPPITNFSPNLSRVSEVNFLRLFTILVQIG